MKILHLCLDYANDWDLFSILRWIDVGQTKFPLLFECAMKYFCIPGSSVPSERVFSASGEILRKRRNRLSGKNANMMIVLNGNI